MLKIGMLLRLHFGSFASISPLVDLSLHLDLDPGLCRRRLGRGRPARVAGGPAAPRLALAALLAAVARLQHVRGQVEVLLGYLCPPPVLSVHRPHVFPEVAEDFAADRASLPLTVVYLEGRAFRLISVR